MPPTVELSTVKPQPGHVSGQAPGSGQATASSQTPASGQAPGAQKPNDPVAATTELPVVRVPRRRYFRELRRARDHGLSLFDKAARDQEWEYDDEP